MGNKKVYSIIKQVFEDNREFLPSDLKKFDDIKQYIINGRQSIENAESHIPELVNKIKEIKLAIKGYDNLITESKTNSSLDKAHLEESRFKLKDYLSDYESDLMTLKAVLSRSEVLLPIIENIARQVLLMYFKAQYKNAKQIIIVKDVLMYDID